MSKNYCLFLIASCIKSNGLDVFGHPKGLDQRQTKHRLAKQCCKMPLNYFVIITDFQLEKKLSMKNTFWDELLLL